MSWLIVVVGLLVMGGVALVLVGRIDASNAGLPESEPDLRPSGESGNEFDVVLRGYRMDEVDARIADLEEQVRSLSASLSDDAKQAR